MFLSLAFCFSRACHEVEEYTRDEVSHDAVPGRHERKESIPSVIESQDWISSVLHNASSTLYRESIFVGSCTK